MCGSGHPARTAAAMTATRHEHWLHAFLEGALLAVDDVAHENVDQRVLHQGEEDKHRAAGHEYVDSLPRNDTYYKRVYEMAE